MKTTSEKEKKLDEALNKLINLNLNQNFKENLNSLNNQKNQLEIEKKEITNKYEMLMKEHERRSIKGDRIFWKNWWTKSRNRYSARGDR